MSARLLKPAEAAHRLGVRTAALISLAARGDLEAEFGGWHGRRYPEDSVEALRAAREAVRQSRPRRDPDLLTPQQAAIRLGLSTAAFLTYEGHGLPEAERTAGGHRRHRRADVDALGDLLASGADPRPRWCGCPKTATRHQAGCGEAPWPR